MSAAPEVTPIELKIGPYSVHAIPTGIFGLDGGSMFGTVPKVLWEKAIPADSKNRIPMEARALLLKSKDRVILIDAGNGSDFVAKYGEKLGPKFAEMYNIDPNGPSLLKSLARAGVTPDQVTDVIFTHLHFDHAGGGTCADSSGKLVPQFRNAKYYVQAANLETAQNPNIREKASYFAANFKPLLDAGVLTLLKGSSEPKLSVDLEKDLGKDFGLANISVGITNGHTQGQQYVKVSSGDTTLVYCADLIPTSAHVRLAWVMGYDLNPLQLIGEKETLLKEAAKGNWYLYFEHDPVVDCAQVVNNGADFEVSKRFKLA